MTYVPPLTGHCSLRVHVRFAKAKKHRIDTRIVRNILSSTKRGPFVGPLRPIAMYGCALQNTLAVGTSCKIGDALQILGMDSTSAERRKQNGVRQEP